MNQTNMKKRHVLPEKPWLVVAAVAGLIIGVALISGFFRSTDTLFSCSLGGYLAPTVTGNPPAAQIQQLAILHYATTKVVPQQSLGEIRISYDVLQSRSPCNFLVFGLGHDSLMWASFNARGKTLFLEEDPKWVQTVLRNAPDLRAHTVKYRTRLSEADDLLVSYRSEPECSASKSYIRNNEKCRLALTGLPDEVYDTEWDLLMIDAPRGYFPEAPGRMGAIYSAAVMARNRKGPGVTHVFLHDVDRKVEKVFAEEFLCRKYLVNGSGRLWHFAIPSAANASAGVGGFKFC